MIRGKLCGTVMLELGPIWQGGAKSWKRRRGMWNSKQESQNTHDLFRNRKEVIVHGAHHGRGQDWGEDQRSEWDPINDSIGSWRPCVRYYFKYKRSHWKVLNNEHEQIVLLNPLPALWENGLQRDMEAEETCTSIPLGSNGIKLWSPFHFPWGCRSSLTHTQKGSNPLA